MSHMSLDVVGELPLLVPQVGIGGICCGLPFLSVLFSTSQDPRTHLVTGTVYKGKLRHRWGN